MRNTIRQNKGLFFRSELCCGAKAATFRSNSNGRINFCSAPPGLFFCSFPSCLSYPTTSSYSAINRNLMSTRKLSTLSDNERKLFPCSEYSKKRLLETPARKIALSGPSGFLGSRVLDDILWVHECREQEGLPPGEVVLLSSRSFLIFETPSYCSHYTHTLFADPL